MRRGQVATSIPVLAVVVLVSATGAEERTQAVDGYAEWRVGSCLIVDAQRVCPAPRVKVKGSGAARDWASIPLGYEFKTRKATRQRDGSLLAREVEARPNGQAMFEGEVRAATDQIENRMRRAGRFSEGEGRTARSVGKLLEEGPRVDRARAIVDDLLPPYLSPDDVRVYVIENPEWNAFAMGNYSIYVFSGLLDDMDDDEVAIVLGHELVHATHEHSRKQAKKSMWIQLAAVSALSAASTIDDDTARAFTEVATSLAASAWSNGYGRTMEDQADRVGLRYAYEAGYDIRKGPRLWDRFARKYGDGSKVVGFFFSDHSQAAARAVKLEREIAYNYPDGPKADGPGRAARSRGNDLPPAVAARPDAGGTLALAAGKPAPDDGAAPADVHPGMTPEEVRRALGEPESALVFGERLRWTYPDRTVVFENGRVAEVRYQD